VPASPADLEPLADLAAEFGLGQLTEATPMPGHPHVVRVATGRGVFLVRPAIPADPALYEQVTRALDRAGIRQAMPLRTTAGSLVSSTGLVVHEFLPGTALLSPSPAQTLAAMRHISAYHAVLRTVPFSAAGQDVWARVMDPAYLLAELPGLGLGDAVQAALDQLADALPLISALPRQLVHGDIGPDNVLMDGDEVVAIIDFTPHYQPVLFAVATAIYWYHVNRRDQPDPAAVSLDADAIGASLDAAGPWTSAERAAWPAMLVLEALRRLATPFAVAAQSGGSAAGGSAAVLSGGSAAVRRRLDAVVAIVRDWPRLSAPTGA
jgi:Ser/Thr protein kinase RdoA (MazF antagonist)